MLVFQDSKKQISPCIASKAKYALGMASKKPKNTKTCSFDYWKRVLEAICDFEKIEKPRLHQAIEKYSKLI